MADTEHKIGKNTGNRGKGRPKGSPNKTTALLKDAILEAARQAGQEFGGEEKDGLISYLKLQAMENPVSFNTLLGKVLPMQVTGEDGGPVEHRLSAMEMTDDELARIAATCRK